MSFEKFYIPQVKMKGQYVWQHFSIGAIPDSQLDEKKEKGCTDVKLELFNTIQVRNMFYTWSYAL